MSLNVDPRITVEQIKNGKIIGIKAIREINNLKAEVGSGIYTLEQMGLETMEELERLKSTSTH